ncbi:MAG: tRNA preQ1(34) S-adenosylmethionine ribosyltransferase-isomerase QueA [Patescibacteria group bacterium]
MNVSDFDYHLPEERIAQVPMEPREQAKLLVLDRKNETIEDRYVFDIPSFLTPGDLLVFNDSKVFKARLHAKTQSGAIIEIFLLRPQDRAEAWLALIKPGRKVQQGDGLLLEDDTEATVVEKHADGTITLDFHRSPDEVFALADRFGEVPTPPYVKASQENDRAYQTVYAKHTGSVAAPTAGFHFTEHLLDELRAKGVRIAFVTLHVGLGTFRPMKTETLEAHEMHEEWTHVPDETADAIAEAKRNGHRVIAVGTTTVRALESAAGQTFSGFTRLFITPGYSFRVIDSLITNFHLPKSTLLVLVSSFAGRDFILQAYKHAIEHDYRFYSFGDAMLIK